MPSQLKQPYGSCPVSVESVRAEVRAAFDDLVQFCLTCAYSFWRFEKRLFVRMAVLGVRLIGLFWAARHERLNLKEYLTDGKYRCGDDEAKRTWKTA
jgi:hypothetical protein